MPNGGGRSADSPAHTSDSEDYQVLKARRRLLRLRVMRRMLNHVRVQKRERQHRKAMQNAKSLRIAVGKRFPESVCYCVCLFL